MIIFNERYVLILTFVCYTMSDRKSERSRHMNQELFAAKLKELRKKSGLSQDGIAEKLGISVQAVSKWECAQSYPDIGLLADIADIYGVSIDYLLRDTSSLDWTLPDIPSDDVLRVIQYRRGKVLCANEYDPDVHIPLLLDAGTKMDIEIWGSAAIEGNIDGSVNAGGKINCGDVGGDVNAGGNIACGEVGGDANAGGSVDCDEVCGNANAGYSVNCGEVGGDAGAGTRVECGDVGGNASAGRDISCGDVSGDIKADGSVSCSDVGGNVSVVNGGVECGDVGGDVIAGNVDCGDVSGDIKADGSVGCSDVGGNVSAANGDVNCGDVGGDVNLGGGISTSDA